jgi:lipid-A-disaccharide synthase
VPGAPGVMALLDGMAKPDEAGWPHVLDPRGFAAPEWEARKRAAFAAADVALAASGTVSLELAAAGTPMVIGYDANALTAAVVRRMVRVDTVTLVNLVTDTRTVPEFLFEDCTPARIAPAVGRLFDDPAAAAAQRAAGEAAMRLLGRGGESPGLRAARSVLGVL